jgi:hypothetical protein
METDMPQLAGLLMFCGSMFAGMWATLIALGPKKEPPKVEALRNPLYGDAEHMPNPVITLCQGCHQYVDLQCLTDVLHHKEPGHKPMRFN